MNAHHIYTDETYFGDDEVYTYIDPEYDSHALEMDFDDELNSLLDDLSGDFDEVFSSGVIIP